MITDETIIKPLSLGRTAIQEAVACYHEWAPQISFEQDVAHYLSEGMVLSTKTCFALARVIEGPRTGKPAWFIRMAVGRLDELLAALPDTVEEICLCRGKKGDLRIRSYSLERMRQLTSNIEHQTSNMGELYGRRRTRQ